MLQELRIKNLALLETMHLELPAREHGLVVFTGETGAGKSIILQAIHLLTGGRGASSWIRSDCDQAEVEAFFLLGDQHTQIREFLQEYDLASEDECLIRRVLNKKGRSRLFINDRAVTTRLAAELTENLINIASQHDHQQLLMVKKHLDYLDAYGELWPMREAFEQVYNRWQKLTTKIRQLQDKELDKEQRRDFLGYQLREIQEIAPVPGEDDRLIRERDRLKASSTLSALARESYQLLQNSVLDHLVTIRKNMEQAAELDSEVRDLSGRISSSCYEIEDLETALRRYRDTLPLDNSRLEEISSRLAQLRGLQRKYGPSLEEVLAFADQAQQELTTLAGLEEELEQLGQVLNEVGAEALHKATALSTARQEVAKKLAAAMEKELDSLHFPQAVFHVSQLNTEETDIAQMHASGRDQVEFLFSANPGEPAKPLVKVVSGGELSRLMLAMKCILARRDQVDTVIFDEVDAGIGGQAAEAVAIKISELAAHHQVFCITHLPQIAAHASAHFFVEKTVDNGRTSTSIRRLAPEERVLELARMLGGENPTAQTLAYARELAQRKGGAPQ